MMSAHLSMKKRPGAALHSSWNWELISDKTLDWWVPRLGRIKQAFPDHVLVASIMAGSGNDTELRHWQELAIACQEQRCDALEINLSCPHMDRPDMGSNVGKDKELVSIVTKVVKEVATIPVWAKLTPSTTDIVIEARGAFLGGADAISSSNTFTSLPLIDAETLDFEVHVDGLVSTGGLGGPAILPLSLAKMSQLTQAFPDKSFSGIGGVSNFEHALNYFLLGCGTVQVCTAAMLDHAIGPNVIRELTQGLKRFLERHAEKGWTRVDELVGARRDRVVAQSKIRRPDEKGYRGGHDGESVIQLVGESGAGRRRDARRFHSCPIRRAEGRGVHLVRAVNEIRARCDVRYQPVQSRDPPPDVKLCAGIPQRGPVRGLAGASRRIAERAWREDEHGRRTGERAGH